MYSHLAPSSIRARLPRFTTTTLSYPVVSPHRLLISSSLTRLKSTKRPTREIYELRTDASGRGYSAVLNPIPDGQSALSVSFEHRAHATKHGCRGVFPPKDISNINCHETFAVLRGMVAEKERLRGTIVHAKTDNKGAVRRIVECVRDTGSGVQAKRSEGDCRTGDLITVAGIKEKGKINLKVTQWGKEKAQEGTQFYLAFRRFLKEYDIVLVTEYITDKDNWLADGVSRKITAEQRRSLPKDIKRCLKEPKPVK